MDLIDRQQAIDKIKDWMKFIGYSHSERNVMECTIQMLEELQSAESRENHTEITRSSRDLIDRQDAIDAFYVQSDNDGWWVGTAQDAEELLNGLPSAEPVIRCKDCQYYYYADNRRPSEREWICGRTGDSAKQSDYCSWAEKEGEKE